MGRQARIWSRDGPMTGSKRSDEQELQKEAEAQIGTEIDAITGKPSGQDNTLILMEF